MTPSCILIGTQTDQEALGNITLKEQHSVAIQCNLLRRCPTSGVIEAWFFTR